MSYFYIASPYTHHDLAVMQARYEKVVDFTSWLIETKSLHVFSPIAHSHPLCRKRNLRPDFHFWEGLDQAMMKPAIGLIVLQIDGWDRSIGVGVEIDFMKAAGKPIAYSSRWTEYDHSM